MTLLIATFAFMAGIVCGLLLRPTLDRRRRLRTVYKAIKQRRRDAAPYVQEENPGYAVPRDYYHHGERRKKGGTLSEDFGLRRRADDKTVATDTDAAQADVQLPRDYYERETPDDEGTLSEGYGLRRKAPPPDAA